MNQSADLFALIPALAAGRAWLFLDYDGTLAGFAPTPDDVLPDEDLIALLQRLASHPDHLRLVILSGRRLAHIRRLAPVGGIRLGGTYGIEMLGPQGETVRAAEDYAATRSVLEQVKAEWQALVEDRSGYFIEDKGWALALHGKSADESGLEEVFFRARQAAERGAAAAPFRILGGQRFLEVAPAQAGKGHAVAEILERDPWLGAAVFYFGDDDKDEEAFAVVRARGGTPVLVSTDERPSAARFRLSSPVEVRRWLATLAEALEATPPMILPP